MSNILEEARAYRKALIAAVPSLDDKTASTAVELFPKLDGNGDLISVGTRVNWNGKLKKAAVDLWDTAENDPDNAPDLWTDIEYRKGYRIISETITATKAFALGECGWWGDVLYRSKRDGNVHTPAQYADVWETV